MAESSDRKIPAQESPASDDTARFEEQRTISGEELSEQIKDEEKKSKHIREEVIRWVISGCMIATIVVGFAALLAAGGTLILHMIMPEYLHWLSDDQYNTLKGSLAGAAISVGVGYVSKYLKE